MKFKTFLIVFVIATIIAAIPVLVWLNTGNHMEENGWAGMLHAPLFGLTLALAVAILTNGWRSFQKDKGIRENGLLFNDGEGPYVLPALGIFLLTFFALLSFGNSYDATVEGSNGWLLVYYVRWVWVVFYGIVSLLWWLLCWLPSPSPTLGLKVSFGIPMSLLCLGSLFSGYGYFNLHGLILASLSFGVNLGFFIVFGLLSLIVRHNKRRQY